MVKTSRSHINRNNKLHAIGKPAMRFYNFGDASGVDALPPKYYIDGINVTDVVNEWLDKRNLDIDNLTEDEYHMLCMFMEGL